MLATLLTLFLVGFVSLVAIGIVLAVVGAMVGLAFTLLFKVAPILLVGYLVVRFMRPKPKQLSVEDQEWLNS
jgi:hypothetical protein